MIAQFNDMIGRGFSYLQPSSRLTGAVLLAVTLLISQHPDEDVAWKWQFYVAAVAIFAFVGWYEIVFVFPINDEIKEMGRKLAESKSEQLAEPEQKKLVVLLRSWEQRHRVRIVVPMVGLAISIAAILV